MAAMDASALESLPLPRTRTELLERIPPARRALEELLASFDDAGLARRDREGWTALDHLSHTAAWERMLVAHLTGGADHAIVGLSAAEFAAATLDEINSRLYELHRHDAKETVLAESAASHDAVVRLIESLSEEDLRRPYWDDDPARRPVIDKLAGDTYRHYLEHRGWIAALAGTGTPA
jgi:hypothetical protein